MYISIRAQYPATGKYDWYESLKKLTSVKIIELAFHSPDNFIQLVEPGPVIFPIEELGFGVPTIHMAHASLNNFKLFMSVFMGTLKLAQSLGCRNIVIHPSRGKLKKFNMVLDHVISPLLNDYDCNILWETFLSKRRFLTAWKDLADFCEENDRHYICYDICHMQRHTTDEVIADIDNYIHLIKGFHFSNWTQHPFQQHLPIRQGLFNIDKIMDALIKENFQGGITLEYLPEFHDQLVPDALVLLRKLYEKTKVDRQL